jgi:hypothetical protein
MQTDLIIKAHKELAEKAFYMCSSCKKKNKCRHYTSDENPCARKWEVIDTLMCACLNGKEK